MWKLPHFTDINFVCIPSHIPVGAEIEYCRIQNVPQPDAVISFVPDPIIYEAFGQWIKDSGIINIFAGPAMGSFIAIYSADLRRGVQFFGRSGSNMNYSRFTLQRLITGQLNLKELAAICGMKQAWEGLKYVRERKYPGKIVVLPKQMNLEFQGIAG